MIPLSSSVSPIGSKAGALNQDHSPGFVGWVASLVHVHRGRLLSYARRRGLDAQDALDAVQDSFISFLALPEARTIATDSDDSIKLLTVILRHNVHNQRRKRARRGRVHALLDVDVTATDSPSSESLIAHAQELALVNGCILRMAKLQRKVVTLSLLDEQPHERVAAVLGISEGYVRVLLHRAREHLRNCDFSELAEPSELADPSEFGALRS